MKTNCRERHLNYFGSFACFFVAVPTKELMITRYCSIIITSIIKLVAYVKLPLDVVVCYLVNVAYH